MRTRAPVALACVTALTLSPAACSPHDPDGASSGSASIAVVDAAGLPVTLRHPASRIVSLVPSATQTLHAIGASGALVGRTDYDRQPWAEGIASVGGGLEPSLEAIVALRPDLVIRFEGDQDPRTRARLDDLGITYLTVRPDHLADISETARLLGRLTGREAAADSLVRAIDEGLSAVSAAVASLPRRPVAYVLGGSPPWVSGPDTYISEILALAGGDNVFSDLGRLYASISPEELRARRIDVVLVPTRGSYDEALTPGARIVEVGDGLELPGPGVVTAAWQVAAAIHGRSLH